MIFPWDKHSIALEAYVPCLKIHASLIYYFQ